MEAVVHPTEVPNPSKCLFARDSVQKLPQTVSADKPEVDLVALDSALQEQERIITMSYALASEASLKSKRVAGWCLGGGLSGSPQHQMSCLKEEAFEGWIVCRREGRKVWSQALGLFTSK